VLERAVETELPPAPLAGVVDVFVPLDVTGIAVNLVSK
jgi:hypothetical protein